ncbi:sugar ABC transporter ATP-binding protein [Klebsiella pneumoniae]|uniref:sugar ABC transporter ATP-binding protein n=1 Tax=Klebsiella pneumoniae TaxID=573 RepID=UPI0026EC08B9|nr:sugar ABC transporter ATP-binding protein [Klebsiella pneumoniae]
MAPHDLVAPQPVESEVIIETRGLSRVYPGVTALDNVNYRVYRNKVNVLIGENGAGKSTMMKMLAGVETPSSGQIILDGEAVSLQSTHQAEKLGISIIFQELNLFPNMNVMDNIFMANEFFQKGRINEKYQYALAKSLLERLELDVDPYAPLGELGIGHQQLVEIARALSKDTRVLIMDEPTSALSQSEVKVLFKVIAQLKRRGVTIIYISHRLEELMEIGDNITIFRDGRFISERHVSDATLPITSLSGGNQQKVVLGKALMTQPQVVFLDEPTRGIDVGAKTDVYHLIGKMAQQGLAVMFSSSELDEVMALADRILVMADGRITADLPRHAVTREQLIAASTPQD